MQINAIEDDKLRKVIAELEVYISGVGMGEKVYKPRKMEKYQDAVKDSFRGYIDSLKPIAKKRGKKYGVRSEDFFKFEERNLVNTFERNVDRAFGQATFSIEKALGKELTNPGFFGLYALLRMKGRKLEEPTKVEGLSRLTKSGAIFSISLIPYLLLLIATAQIEWDRRLSQTLAIENGVDLVRIDPHPCWLGPNVEEVCNRWRDRIVSLSGFTPGFPRLEEALEEKPPLFHPNCTHTMKPLTVEEQAKAIEGNHLTYSNLLKG